MFFNPIVLFWRASRRFGFLRTLIVTVVGIIALSLAAQAFAASPPKPPVADPPRLMVPTWGNDLDAFEGTDGSICRPDGSVCPVSVHLQARFTNGPSRYSHPIVAQLYMTVSASQCEEITCGETLQTSPLGRPVVVFLDGHQLTKEPAIWQWVGGTVTHNPDGHPLNADARFLSFPLVFGFSGFCGWHTLRFGIRGDKWAGTSYYPPDLTLFPLWTLTGPMPFYSGACPGADRFPVKP